MAYDIRATINEILSTDDKRVCVLYFDSHLNQSISKIEISVQNCFFVETDMVYAYSELSPMHSNDNG